MKIVRTLLFFAALLTASCGASPQRPLMPTTPRARASRAFWSSWGDGNAEMSSYRATVMRYGAPREAELVLIYVTEPHDRETLIKDDDVPPERRVQMLKLNISLRFQTGIYPYSVLTSVFAPVDAYYAERFAPAKLTISVQEWCGHVYGGVFPAEDRFTSSVASYFASEGEVTEMVPAAGALYEDALLVQLRELDGPFAGGGDWEGLLVPSLWRNRQAHEPLRPVEASITRTETDERVVFVLRAGTHERTYEVEREGAHRVMAFRDSEGDHAELVATDRLPYWQLNGPGDESARERIGLTPR